MNFRNGNPEEPKNHNATVETTHNVQALYQWGFPSEKSTCGTCSDKY